MPLNDRSSSLIYELRYGRGGGRVVGRDLLAWGQEGVNCNFVPTVTNMNVVLGSLLRLRRFP